jgi:hypothetical protein
MAYWEWLKSLTEIDGCTIERAKHMPVRIVNSSLEEFAVLSVYEVDGEITVDIAKIKDLP